jgi:hypothetical protein
MTTRQHEATYETPHYRTHYSHMIVTGRRGSRSPVSAGLNLKKRVKIGLVCRKNSQLLEIAAFFRLGYFARLEHDIA